MRGTRPDVAEPPCTRYQQRACRPAAALVLMVALARTLTAAAVRRLDFRRWQILRRLAYLACNLAVIHFISCDLDSTSALTR